MNKEAEYSRGRDDGLALALRLVREGGPQALERECRIRGATGIHTSLAQKELDKKTTAIKLQTCDTVMILVTAVLHDEFGFGLSRLKRFQKKFDEGVRYLMDGSATWMDYIEAIKEQLGFELTIRWNGKET